MKKIIVFILAVFMLIACSAYAEDDKLSIVVTDFPCYDFARAVAGDRADITMLIKPGSEVHSYEPTPSDVIALSEADLFIYIGGESDSWVDNMLASMGDDAPEALRMFDCVEICEAGDGHHDHEGHDHEYDEHIWTSPVNAMLMVSSISEAVSAIDVENSDIYSANEADYNAQIADIHAQISDLVANAARTELVFGDRFPFLYLAREYGLTYHAAFPGCAAETEPSAQTIMELIMKVAKDKIPAVYVIEMSTGNVASAIAEETDAEIVTLHSIQNVSADEFEAGETYVSIMQKNIEALRKGLY
ncbi:MAG: zinc ABC transporter substrate-binding protein [Clostridia bacterium]|nr:zinc ABC transporter substrate-binding protein [Clostridia bacterium]